MVVIKKSFNSVIVPIALTSILFLESCNNESNEDVDPKSQTDLLVGDWKKTEVNGIPIVGDEDIYSFTFTISGDFKDCHTYTIDDYTYCGDYQGKWRWKNAAEDAVILDQWISGSNDEWELDIHFMDENNMDASLTNPDGSSFHTDKYKFIKIK